MPGPILGFSVFGVRIGQAPERGEVWKTGYYACAVLLELPVAITQALAQGFASQDPHCFFPELSRFFPELLHFPLRALLCIKPHGNEHTKD